MKLFTLKKAQSIKTQSVKMMVQIVCVCLLPVVALKSLAQQTIIIPIGQQQTAVADLPKQGMSAKAVIAQFGEPLKIEGPRGQPPITRWYFEGFSVYFESEAVLHSVSTFRRGNTMPTIIEQD